MMTAAEREKAWVERIQEYRESKKTQMAWCQENGVSQRTFTKWLRKIRYKNCASMEGNEKRQRFIPVQEMYETQAPSAITIRIGRAAIEVKTGYDTKALTEVIEIVGATC
jgi:chromatin segregation and condensation protein Rec8/ScpA/Scc1 (kleisin family)